VNSKRTLEELALIYCNAVEAHTSLVCGLAQHNGMIQFGLENADRMPPIEFRYLLQEGKLEASIEEGLETLLQLSRDLQRVRMHGHSRTMEIRDNMAAWLDSLHEDCHGAFAKQQSHMRELAAASPRFSPMLHPMGSLGKRLAAVIPSPPGSRYASPQSVCTEPTSGPWCDSGSRSSRQGSFCEQDEHEALHDHLKHCKKTSASFLNLIEEAACVNEERVEPQKENSAFGALFSYFNDSDSNSSQDGKPFTSLFSSSQSFAQPADIEKPLPYVFSLTEMSTPRESEPCR